MTNRPMVLGVFFASAAVVVGVAAPAAAVIPDYLFYVVVAAPAAGTGLEVFPQVVSPCLGASQLPPTECSLWKSGSLVDCRRNCVSICKRRRRMLY